MTDTLAREFQAGLQRLDALLRGVERFADPEAQAHTREVVRAVLDCTGRGWPACWRTTKWRGRPAKPSSMPELDFRVEGAEPERFAAAEAVAP